MKSGTNRKIRSRERILPIPGAFLLRLILLAFRSRRVLAARLALVEKENEILRRSLGARKPRILDADRRVLAALAAACREVFQRIRIVKPETLLAWQHALARRRWTFAVKRRRGRPAVPAEVKRLVLAMKNENLSWGAKRIQGELRKVGVDLCKKTVQNILRELRRAGKVRRSLAWRRFLRMQARALYAMDCFSVDTLSGVRFEVFFIIAHRTREIVQFAIARNPTREFVRQQLILFEGGAGRALDQATYMIRDNAAIFDLEYAAYGLTDVRTSIRAPNMNAIAERFVGSARRECLDWHLLVSEAQIRRLLTEYIDYYNTGRPHQGIGQAVPAGYIPRKTGAVRRRQVLGGLHHHYYREAG